MKPDIRNKYEITFHPKNITTYLALKQSSANIYSLLGRAIMLFK